jgi:CubicO group peptidase (beta-lactamase class C family)
VLFDDQLKEVLANLSSPGIAIAICDRNRVLWQHIGGYSDPEDKIPVDFDTLFHIGSVTRAFTGQAILILRDEGLLALDEPLELSIPEMASIRYPTLDSPRITLRHLLTHTSGLPREMDHLGDEREFAAHLPKLTLDHAPGAGATHSALGFALLGLVIQRKSGKSYDVFVKERILEPLSMSTATFSSGVMIADDGLCLSARELARFVNFQLNAWPPRDDSDPGPLKRASVRESHCIGGLQLLGPRPKGLGWELLSDRPLETIVWHNARSQRGHQVAVAFEPTVGIGIIALASAQFHSDRPLRALLCAYAIDHDLVKDERR